MYKPVVAVCRELRSSSNPKIMKALHRQNSVGVDSCTPALIYLWPACGFVPPKKSVQIARFCPNM